jgi:hypothetical protein
MPCGLNIARENLFLSINVEIVAEKIHYYYLNNISRQDEKILL